MHFAIRVSVIIFAVGMFIQRPGRIEFEPINSLIDKIHQMVEPMFLTGGRFAGLFGQIVFLGNRHIMVDTQPQRHLESEFMQPGDKQRIVFVFG